MQQNGSAMWAAIILLAAVAGVFAVMGFNAQEKIHGLEDMAKNGAPQDFQQKYGNDKVKAVLEENLRHKDDIAQLNTELLKARAETGEARRHGDDLDGLLARANTALKSEQDRARNERASLEAKHRDEVNNLRRTASEQQAAANEFRRAYDAKAAEADALRVEITNYRTAIDAVQQKIHGIERTAAAQIKPLIDRIAASSKTVAGVVAKTKTSDGKILTVNLKDRVVHISIGSEQRVSAGMRFQVTRPRVTGDPDVIAEIEITHVYPATSQAVILTRTTPKKRDPYTGWTTMDPNAKYSIYSLEPYDKDGKPVKESGEAVDEAMTQKMLKAVALESLHEEEVSSMDNLNPVMVGDDIFNLLFDPERVYRFVHVGEPVTRTKEAIAAIVRENGGELDEEVGSTTDFVILGLIPDDKSSELDDATRARIRRMKEQEELAKQYGSRIIREAELFNFFMK